MENFRQKQQSLDHNQVRFYQRPAAADWVAIPALDSSSTPLALRAPAPARATAAKPYLIQWLQSGGNLDFCVLAMCSCVLTLLCHQLATQLSSPSAAERSIVAASAAKPAEIDFFIKAALFTSFPQIEQQSQAIRDRLGSF